MLVIHSLSAAILNVTAEAGVHIKKHAVAVHKRSDRNIYKIEQEGIDLNACLFI